MTYSLEDALAAIDKEIALLGELASNELHTLAFRFEAERGQEVLQSIRDRIDREAQVRANAGLRAPAIYRNDWRVNL